MWVTRWAFDCVVAWAASHYSWWSKLFHSHPTVQSFISQTLTPSSDDRPPSLPQAYYRKGQELPSRPINVARSSAKGATKAWVQLWRTPWRRSILREYAIAWIGYYGTGDAGRIVSSISIPVPWRNCRPVHISHSCVPLHTYVICVQAESVNLQLNFATKRNEGRGIFICCQWIACQCYTGLWPTHQHKMSYLHQRHPPQNKTIEHASVFVLSWVRMHECVLS